MSRQERARKRTITAIFNIEIIFFALIVIILISDVFSGDITGRIVILYAMLISIAIILPFLIKGILYKAYLEQIRYEENEKYVFKHFVVGETRKVIPIQDELDHEYFLTEVLTERADMYATLRENERMVITLKFYNEEVGVYYGSIHISNFKDYFRIVD